MAASRRVAIVTGSNKGVGLAIVRKLCRQFEGDVFLTARNEERGQEAIKLLQAEGLNPKFHELDIDSLPSIESLKKYMQDTYSGIDMLINNAGMAYKSATTASNIEQATNTIKTNFTGTLDMMKAFMPLVRPHGRIVNVASMVGHLSRLSSQALRDKMSSPSLTESELVGLMEQFIDDVKEGKHLERGWANTFYSNSKVAVVALTKIHAREMAATGKEDVLINCCCPGWVRTDMAGSKAPLSPDEGAETPVLVALLPPGSPTGEFWREKVIKQW